jgi:hypothetical protein
MGRARFWQHHRADMGRPVTVHAAAAALAAAGLAGGSASAGVPPQPIPQEPHSSQDFIGAPALQQPVLAPPVPRHPFMAPNERSNLHNDAYSSDVNTGPGPLGRDMETLSTGLFRECASLTFDSRDRIVTVCVGVDGPQLLMLDPRTLELLADFPLPPRQPSGAEVFTSFGGGGYFYLDERDRAVIPTTTLQIFVVAETDQPGFRLERSYDLRAHLPPDDSIVSALPDFAGRIWFVTSKGFVGAVDPESGAVRTHRLEGEGITNSFSSDESGGMFVVSDRALYRFEADAGGAPVVVWREAYENTLERKPGQVDDGSGTTPTVMGSDFVNITDNADPMNVLVYRRGRDVPGSRLVCRQPVFEAGQSATDNSLITTDRSIVVENNYGYASPQSTSDGRTTSAGLERVDLDADGAGCRKVWRSEEASPSIVPKLSLANGLVYAYTKIPGDDKDPWYLTAIDFRTGRTVFKKLAGAGLGFNNHYAPATLGPDGTAYVGVLGGLVLLRDREPPPRPGRVTPRLALRLAYRSGPAFTGAAGGARRCARSGVRATVVPRRGSRTLDPEQIRHVDFLVRRKRLRRDFTAPFSRTITRRLVRPAGIYRVRARVRLGDGRTVRLTRHLRSCGTR